MIKMVLNEIISYFQGIIDSIPPDQKLFVSLVVYTLLIFMYALFIWKFYRFLASREIIQLNLKQYNYSGHPGIEKIFAVVLYTLEYLIVLPFLVVFWFAILSIFLLVLSESQNTQQILLVSAAIIASTRLTAYVSEDLSKDLAKILPFTVLAAFILSAEFFDTSSVLTKISHVPGLLGEIAIFLVFIFIIEFILRALFSFVELIRSGSEDDVEG